MSEELQSKYLKKSGITGQKIGDFEYFQIGATTFKQLEQAKLIPGGYDKSFISHKPDRLFIDRRGSKPVIIAVIEDKKSGKFNNESKKIKAIQQCNNYCQELNAKMGIITDGMMTIWINPHEKNKNTEYKDAIIKKKRSYSFIKKEDGIKINYPFKISEKQDFLNPEKMSDEIKDIYKYIKEIYQKINHNNSIIKEPKRIDPLPLARRVWQDIWVATGKSPKKCLYNVVELFIFKFLSDLKVLTDQYSFENLYQLQEKGDKKEILDYYAKVCRPRIKELFPSSTDDDTTIINGTIFVNEQGEANLGQATLFCNSLKKFKEFEKEQGTFEHIDKDFKTKLFETFLKQSEGQKALGQFFTPRKVVQAVVKMSGVENLKKGARFCDPFCGVGGFVLEPINLYRINDFEPRADQVKPPIEYFGFDKGFEKDEERTIILAKANMLLYLTEIISKNPTLTKKFAEIFNKVFRLWQSNLGTLEHIFKEEEEKFDLILTNPPYVTSGSSSLKNEILENTDLSNFYSINAGGVEGLGLEWIIKNLKKEGKAFIVIPDGILNRLNDKKIRRFILDECYLEGIISLPVKTFFSTPKKTYILAITKKEKKENKQDFSVFTYLVSNIGETLDVNRFDIPENDLNEAVDLFNQFQGIKRSQKVQKVLETQSNRCKIQALDKFEPEKHWCVDRWWVKEEKVELGIEEGVTLLSPEDFFEKLQETHQSFNELLKKFEGILKKKFNKELANIKFKNVVLNKVIDFSQRTNTSKFTKSFINRHKGDIPVYSASNNPNFISYGYVQDNLPSVRYFENCMTWNIDGSVGNVFIRKGRFTLSEKVIPLILFSQYENYLNKKYLKLAVEKAVIEKGYAFNNKASKSKLQKIIIQIPIDKNGNFDLKLQKEFVEQNKKIKDIQNKVKELKEKIKNVNIGFDEEFENKEILLSKLFNFKQGKALTQKDIQKKKGEYPVYSSNTLNNGRIGFINSYDYNCESITWTTRGANAGTVFYRNGKYSLTNNCGIMLIKNNYKYFLNLYYVYTILHRDFKNYTKGTDNKMLTEAMLKNVSIQIPINKKGKFDFEKQKEIAQKYEKVEKLKKELTEKLDMLANYKISLE